MLYNLGTLIESQTRCLAMLPCTPHSKPLLDNPLCSWEAARDYYSTKSVFCQGFWLPQNEHKTYKENHVSTSLEGPSETEEREYLGESRWSFGCVTCSSLWNTPENTLTAHCNHSLIKFHFLNWLTVASPAKSLSLFPDKCGGCTIVLAHPDT